VLGVSLLVRMCKRSFRIPLLPTSRLINIKSNSTLELLLIRSSMHAGLYKVRQSDGSSVYPEER
jgi:hypothetical protein